MESARKRSSAPVLPLSCFSIQRSLSPTRHFYSSSSSTIAAASASSAFDFPVERSMSPNRYGSASGSSSLNFALDRSVSPNRNLQARSPVRPVRPKAGNTRKPVPSVPARKVCMCSPTNHPGSFRCSLHRNSTPHSSSPSTQNHLHMRRSAMTNSLVRIGSVEGEWVKRALTTLIRPSSHQLRRRTSFQPQPSRLRNMTKAEDDGLS